MTFAAVFKMYGRCEGFRALLRNSPLERDYIMVSCQVKETGALMA